MEPLEKGRQRRPERRRSAPGMARQRGAVAILVGLSIAVLVGFIGLALDGGRLYVNKTELQNAADACALAAAYELTASPNIAPASFTQAENAGMLVSTRNRVGFQGAGIQGQAVRIEFGTSLSGGGWLAASSNPSPDARYVRCTLTETGITPWFMQVLGFGDQTVSAMATATLERAQTNCGLPLGMCTQDTTPPYYGMVKGQWYGGRFSAGGGLTGSFNWIDYSPPSGGAKEVAELLKGSGTCELNIPGVVGEPGMMGDAVAQAWNSRFGLYLSGQYTLSSAPPDWTGYPYTAKSWAPGSNALDDFLARRIDGDSYGSDVDAGNTLTGLKIKKAYDPTTTPEQHRKFGADRRLVVAPLVNCSEWATSQTVPIRNWACVLLLHPIADPHDEVKMEFVGLASDPDSPCATSGVVGNSTSVGPLVPALVQ